MFDFLWNWVNYLLSYFAGKRARVVFLGLANAGKSTLMDLLRDGRLRQHAPTQRARSAEMTMGDVTFTVYDLGGHRQARRVWRDYFPAVDAVVFMIDAADHEQFNESKDELHRVLSDEDILHCPVLILANKIDKREAVNFTETVDAFGLHMFLTGKDRRYRTERHVISYQADLPNSSCAHWLKNRATERLSDG